MTSSEALQRRQHTIPHATPTFDLRRSGQLQGAAAALAIIVAAIHIIDQGGLIGDKSPRYVGVGYWLLELTAIGLAVVLMRSTHRFVWLTSLGVGVGPLIGFVLSRGPGLPGYTDDRGNWGEPLGVASLVVEGLLVLVSLTGLAIARSRQPGEASPTWSDR